MSRSERSEDEREAKYVIKQSENTRKEESTCWEEGLFTFIS